MIHNLTNRKLIKNFRNFLFSGEKGENEDENDYKFKENSVGADLSVCPHDI